MNQTAFFQPFNAAGPLPQLPMATSRAWMTEDRCKIHRILHEARRRLPLPVDAQQPTSPLVGIPHGTIDDVDVLIIIADLLVGDTATLGACVRASRLFCVIFQPRLFRKLDFRKLRGPSLSRLETAFRLAPRLKKYLQDLTMDLPKQVGRGQVMAKLIEQLDSSLKAISIVSHLLPNRSQSDFQDCAMALIQEIFALIGRGQLERFFVEEVIRVPPGLVYYAVAHVPNVLLHGLRIRMDLDDGHVVDIVQNTRVPSAARHLSTRSCGDPMSEILQGLARYSFLPNIASLSTELDPWNVNSWILLQQLAAAAPQLQHLELALLQPQQPMELLGMVQPPSTTPDILRRPFGRVQSLRLSFPKWTFSFSSAVRLSQFIPDSITTHLHSLFPFLRRLEISFTVSYHLPHYPLRWRLDVHSESVSSELWHSLDGKAGWSSLQEVVFGLAVQKDDGSASGRNIPAVETVYWEKDAKAWDDLLESLPVPRPGTVPFPEDESDLAAVLDLLDVDVGVKSLWPRVLTFQSLGGGETLVALEKHLERYSFQEFERFVHHIAPGPSASGILEVQLESAVGVAK